MLLLNYSPDISQGREKMLALLFDMNKLWEEFVLQMLKKASKDNPEIKVRGQDSMPFWGNNYLQPDIVIEKFNGEDRSISIIDTKWKRPTNKVASIGDLRQMYTYNKFWKSNKAMLLYPGQADDMTFKPFKNPHEEVHKCKMHFLAVEDLFEIGAYKELIKEMVDDGMIQNIDNQNDNQN